MKKNSFQKLDVVAEKMPRRKRMSLGNKLLHKRSHGKKYGDAKDDIE